MSLGSWVVWVGAATLGWVLFLVIIFIWSMGWLIGGYDPFFPFLEEHSIFLNGGVVGAAAQGAVIGFGQWLVLRRIFCRAGWWPFTTIVGATVGAVLAEVEVIVLPIALSGVSAPIALFLPPTFLGIAQWLILKNWGLPRAGWWVFASALGGIPLIGGIVAGLATGSVLDERLRTAGQ